MTIMLHNFTTDKIIYLILWITSYGGTSFVLSVALFSCLFHLRGLV